MIKVSDISRLCSTVDLYKAIQYPINSWISYGTGYARVGLEDLVDTIDNIIDSKLKKIGFSCKDINYFFEFSILPTILDPVSSEKLECFSFLRGDDTFQDIFTIKPGSSFSVYEQVIIDMQATSQISVFHHPNFLFDIGAGGSSPITVTHVGPKGMHITKVREEKKKVIMMPRSYSETIQKSKDYYKSSAFRPLSDIQEMLHKDIIHKISNIEDSFFISFPIVGTHSSNQLPHNTVQRTTGVTPIQGVGAFFLFIESCHINNSIAKDISEELFVSIGELGRLFAVNYLFNLGLQLQENARREAIKSAKAAIMSRNMSHNIGSHVMSYLKQHLGSVKDIVADGILSDLINGENELAKKLENTTENTTLPFLMGLGHFISYIQERQDFIATIATDYIPYFGNVNFKDTIYDELNPDKRAERHTERTNGKTDNILLGNIARSEGLGRNNQSTSKRSGQLADIILNFQDSDNNVFDGNPVVNKDNPVVGRENAKKALEAMRKWEISVPGGVIGRQAFFSIVENLIRNTAKHGNWRDQGKLELTFSYYTKDSLTEEFCSLKEREAEILRRNTDKDGKLKKLSKEDEDKLNDIRKSLEKWNEDAAPTEKPHFWGEDKKKHNSLMEVLWYFYGQSLDADDLYFVTITDNVNISEKAVDKLRGALVEDYIDNESKMIEGNKGIKEIRISAAWLRGAKNEDEYYNSGAKLIDPQTWEKAPLVYVRQHSGCLQYIICLQKPRKLAIVSWRSFSEESEKAFKKLNCRYYTPETYREEKNKSFDFILFDDSKKAEKDEYSYEALKPISSSRFWKLSDIEELAKKDNKEEPELFKKLQNVTEECLDDILLLLYKKLSHYETGDSIWIDDKTAAANVGRDADGMTPKYIKSDYITVQDGISKGVRKYIYRTHHDSEKEYSNYIDAVNDGTIEGNIFVEGISGNNSTDRLVRNEKLDDIWFYKHLHAMKEQVAVFDERLFTKIFGIEESHLKDEGTFKIDDSNRDLYRERYYEEIINSNDEQYSSFVDNNTQEEQDRKLLEIFKNETSPTTSKDNVDAQNGIKPIVYKQKGVYVFTLIQDPNPDKQNVFNLYGLSKESSITKAICIKIASLSWSQTDGLRFDGKIRCQEDQVDGYVNNYKQFDRISIHQGLLDKLYEMFGIKDKPQDKERLTRQFHQAFSNSKNENKNFLPGFCIHSGRSKPSQIDMPQKLPFIQYASIENAVLDCKYSLVELLDFARYE